MGYRRRGGGKKKVSSFQIHLELHKQMLEGTAQIKHQVFPDRVADERKLQYVL